MVSLSITFSAVFLKTPRGAIGADVVGPVLSRRGPFENVARIPAMTTGVRV